MISRSLSQVEDAAIGLQLNDEKNLFLNIKYSFSNIVNALNTVMNINYIN